MKPTESERDLWLRAFHDPANSATADPSMPRLVCFPHAGGSATYYHPLSVALQGEVDVRSVQYPGRQDRRHEEFVTDLKEMARQLVPMLLSLTDRPLALFGHSMGATIAFEAARMLEQEHGVRLAALFVSARPSPEQRRNLNVHKLDDEGVLNEIRNLNGTDPAVFGDDELVRMVLPVIRSDYHAVEDYVYEPGAPIHAPIISLIGDADARIPPEDMLGWREVTAAAFESHVFAGGHFYLGPRAAEIIELLRKYLATYAVSG